MSLPLTGQTQTPVVSRTHTIDILYLFFLALFLGCICCLTFFLTRNQEPEGDLEADACEQHVHYSNPTEWLTGGTPLPKYSELYPNEPVGLGIRMAVDDVHIDDDDLTSLLDFD
ncbi:hypothetical protein IAQ61_009569 [Plenodomus lingam]|nr:hypothetical protein IAQ61_009569 [Plenodomus lingam]